MFSQFRQARYRQIRFREQYDGERFQYAFTSVDISCAKIIVYDYQGVKKAEIGTETQYPYLTYLTFSHNEHGSKDFEMRLSSSVDIDVNDRVEVRLFGQKTSWYKGYISQIPADGETKIEQIYKGFGLYEQLQFCIVPDEVNTSAHYESTEISAIVEDIAKKWIEPKTNVVYNSTKNEATGYTAQDIFFKYVTAKQALSDLAEIAQDYVFGVDETGDLFFKAKTTSVNTDCCKWADKHFAEFTRKQKIYETINRIYLMNGKIHTDKSNYVGMVEDTSSQSTYHFIHEKVLSLSSSKDDTDTTRWGNYKLSQLKEPVEQAQVKDLDIALKRVLITATGKARIFKEGTKYELEIKRVKYKLDGKGIKVDLELGEEYTPIADELLKMIRGIAENESMLAQNTEQMA